MDRQLADHLEKNADLAKTPFIQNAITERILEKTGGEGLYHNFDIDLSVTHTNEEYEFSGDRLIVESVEDAVTLKLNSIKNSAIDLQKIPRIKGSIKRFFITNAAGSGTLKLIGGCKGMFDAEASDVAVKDEITAVKTEMLANRSKLKVVDLTSTVTVGHGATGSYAVKPDVGCLWKVKNLYVCIPDPSGSSSGAHALNIGPKNSVDTVSSGQNYLMYASSNFGTAIMMGYNQITEATTKKPSASSDQMTIIETMIASHDHPLNIVYNNNTDVDQAADIEIVLWVEEIPERA